MKRPEQVLFMFGALAALVSLAWHSIGVDTASSLPPRTNGGEERMDAEKRPQTVTDIVDPSYAGKSWQWEGPPPEIDLAHGGGDLFSAPPLEQDAATGRLRIRAADAHRRDDEAAFGLSLVEVVREPFRLQLVGYAADEDGWIGVFENRHSGRVFLARAPQDVPELNVRIESLNVERRRTELPGTGTVAGRVAVARVQDRDGTTIELSSGTRRTVGRPKARFRDTAGGATFDAVSGSEFAVDGVTFRVDAITEERVQVCRLESGSPAERRWLVIGTTPGTP